jgi:hypothetical protein
MGLESEFQRITLFWSEELQGLNEKRFNPNFQLTNDESIIMQILVH